MVGRLGGGRERERICGEREGLREGEQKKNKQKIESRKKVGKKKRERNDSQSTVNANITCCYGTGVQLA